MDRKRVARERIRRLFNLAEEIHSENPELADRYVMKARRISMRARVRIPRELRRKKCSDCHSYLVPGDNARFRLRDGYLTLTCLECGNQSRYPY